MKIDERRVQKLNSHSYESGPVLYWMNREGRVHDNWALLYAQEIAKENNAPLVVCYNLDPGFLGGGYRQHAFKIKGLMEVEQELKKLDIPFFIVEGKETEKALEQFIEDKNIGAVVTDFFPLRHPRMWVDYLRKNIAVPIYGVDAHNIVPVWITSEKQEYAARTIRPKLHRLLPEFLTEIPKTKKHEYLYKGKIEKIDWQALIENPEVDRSVEEVDWVTSGSQAANKMLKIFIKERLDGYAEKRNDPNRRSQSDLSPYLHYGHISEQRIALEIVKATETPVEDILHADRNGSATSNDASAFLEELIIRSELSDNFCFYNSHYDSSRGFPDWAQKTLMKHSGDEREHLYSLQELEQAETHDDLWNAAQREMTQSGKMHGYMRMYWAKKILEWTEHPDQAMEFAIYLNDRYELDGRDPRGYVGIAWSMGGVHDRPWFDREIFGTVRYMARSGCEKKFDVEKYIQKWN